MSIYSRFPNGNTSTRRALGVQQVLEWAFRTEKARLELPEPPDPERDEGLGFGLEYVLMQRAAPGCRIDGGRYKPTVRPTRMPRSSPPASRAYRRRWAALAWRSASRN